MSEKIRIIVADDHPIVREGLRTAIGHSGRIEIVAETGDGDEALRLIGELNPDICVLDIDMPGRAGFDIIRQIETPTIFLTVHREPEMFEKAIELGARGYILKDSALAEIVIGIESVARGDFFTSPAMTAYLIGRRKKSGAADGVALLTETERRVLKLLAGYKTSKEIANEMYISPRTVETHRKNIAAKLDLSGSHALMKFALAHENEL